QVNTEHHEIGRHAGISNGQGAASSRSCGRVAGVEGYRTQNALSRREEPLGQGPENQGGILQYVPGKPPGMRDPHQTRAKTSEGLAANQFRANSGEEGRAGPKQQLVEVGLILEEQPKQEEERPFDEAEDGNVPRWNSQLLRLH